jgi:histidine triad (HIT) family protein
MNDGECVFCEIVRGDAESSVVYDDADVLAFMDLQPVTAGHLLVVPKTHAVGLDDLDVEHGQKVWTVAHQLSRVLRRSGLRCDGINLFLADGEAAFQEVFHVHLHVFPRFVGDSFRMNADWCERERSELDETAAVLRKTLAALTT